MTELAESAFAPATWGTTLAPQRDPGGDPGGGRGAGTATATRFAAGRPSVPSGDASAGAAALALLRNRRSRPALTAPAPDPERLHEILTAACSAPDHGRLRPWRFLVVTGDALEKLGDVFAAAHADRDPTASAADLDRTRGRALRAPMIVVVVSSPRPHPKIARREQQASAACAAHGVVLAAHALGYGAMWRSGWFGEAPAVRTHLGLAEGEDVTGWIYLGTPAGPAPAPRRPIDPPVTWLS